MGWFFFTEKNFLTYHNWEEVLIAVICLTIALRSFWFLSRSKPAFDPEQKSKIFLTGAAFLILSASSLTHAFIHANHLNLNLLYQTLLGYCLGFLTLIVAISSEKPVSKVFFPLLYLPLLVLLLPDIYERFPIFGEFRPLVWIGVAYLAGHVCMLHCAIFYRTRNKMLLWSAAGFLFICISAIFLFFPTAIGSSMWLHGHLFRPIGFMVLLLAMPRPTFSGLEGSILYRAISAYSLLAAIPLLVFGAVLFYENINPIHVDVRRLLVFLLFLVTFASALIFGLGLIIRLVRPILSLKKSVDLFSEEGLDKSIAVTSNDEIGQLTKTFNGMMVKLKNSAEEQERLSRLAATGELAATLAHEIKNPLNAIGGASSYIRKNSKGSLVEEFTKIISEEADRINKLTGNLLDFAKPLQSEFHLNDINVLARKILLLLGNEAKEQGLKLNAALSEDLPKVLCDQNQIKQVLLNLMINAFDATGKKGEVTVSTVFMQGQVLLSVADNGKGIPPENIKQLFNPFFTTKTRGTGLGLAISKKIARENHGDLIVESTPGQGSKFTLVLPRGI